MGWLKNNFEKWGLQDVIKGIKDQGKKGMNLQSPLQDTSGMARGFCLLESIAVCEDFATALFLFVRPCDAIQSLLAFDTARAVIFVVLKLVDGFAFHLGVCFFSTRLPFGQKFPANYRNGGK